MADQILLGYDLHDQVTVARYQRTTIVCTNSHRAREVVNGLCDVAEDLPRSESLGKVDGVEIVIQGFWMKFVQYSDQAWEDLLSVALTVETQ